MLYRLPIAVPRARTMSIPSRSRGYTVNGERKYGWLGSRCPVFGVTSSILTSSVDGDDDPSLLEDEEDESDDDVDEDDESDDDDDDDEDEEDSLRLSIGLNIVKIRLNVGIFLVF
jgi:hypothetical protein